MAVSFRFHHSSPPVIFGPIFCSLFTYALHVSIFPTIVVLSSIFCPNFTRPLSIYYLLTSALINLKYKISLLLPCSWKIDYHTHITTKLLLINTIFPSTILMLKVFFFPLYKSIFWWSNSIQQSVKCENETSWTVSSSGLKALLPLSGASPGKITRTLPYYNQSLKRYDLPLKATPVVLSGWARLIAGAPILHLATSFCLLKVKKHCSNIYEMKNKTKEMIFSFSNY